MEIGRIRMIDGTGFVVNDLDGFLNSLVSPQNFITFQDANKRNITINKDHIITITKA